jgi:CO/xanthine dehydrogenase Mo-binding subunit
MLFGATVRSPHPHARIEAVNFDREKAPAGTVFVSAADLPGPNGVQLIDASWPILAQGVVRHVGEPVALVAAPTRLAARRALAAVTVEYTPLTPMLTLEEAAAEEPLYTLAFGSEAEEVTDAFATAAHVVEGVYRTGHQEHIYIETQGLTAWWEEGAGEGERLVVMGSMQCPYYVQKALEHAFPGSERIQVKASAVGGGFGGKEDYPSMLAIHGALLARAAKRPVRLVYDRQEDIIGTTKRHPSVVRHRTAVDGEGHLLAAEIDVTLDGGAYITLSTVVLSRALLHAAGPYRCPAVRIQGRVLRTHTATNGAFRGFGAPQTQFAIERHLDRIARRLGLSPLEIRRRNLLRAGDRLPTGQVLDDSTAAEQCLEKAAAVTDFEARWRALEAARESGETQASRDDGEPWRGLGLSLYFHGAGFTGTGERRMRSPVEVRLRDDGRIEVLTAMVDMGQGCDTIFPQMACQASGLDPADLVFPPPDTAVVPDSGPTVASRTTLVVGRTLGEAVVGLRDRVVDWWRSAPENRAERPFQEMARAFLAAGGDGFLRHHYEPPSWQDFDETTYRGSAYPTYGWGADVVEVAVDPDTLAVRPLKVTAVCDVGKVIHPTLCRGQVEGGTLQAIAWGLMEEIKMEGGRYRNDRLATYIIPTFEDAPDLDVHLLEVPWAEGPFGAKGVGELPMNGGAPAAVAAVENATGTFLDTIPATPERLLAARREEEA